MTVDISDVAACRACRYHRDGTCTLPPAYHCANREVMWDRTKDAR